MTQEERQEYLATTQDKGNKRYYLHDQKRSRQYRLTWNRLNFRFAH
jgi:hypothetical protein